LYAPDTDAVEAANLTADELPGWGKTRPTCELECMIEDDLAGLIDGPTGENIQLNVGLQWFVGGGFYVVSAMSTAASA
jgi:hypothetical protein